MTRLVHAAPVLLILSLAVAATGIAAAFPTAARADDSVADAVADAVVLLDRGSSSDDPSGRRARLAAEIVERLRAQGVRAHLVLYGSLADGRTRSGELKGDPTKALAASGDREGWGFEGPTDPRMALEVAVRRVRDTGALSVFLLGRFEGEGLDEGRMERALKTWTERAPAGSRIYAIEHRPERLALLEGAAGTVVDGLLVVRVGELVIRPRPFSPLAADPETQDPLQADLGFSHFDAYEVGRGRPTGAPPPFTLSSRTEGDAFIDTSESAGQGTITRQSTMTRRGGGGRVATVSLTKNDAPDVLWLADPPAPQTFRWETLRPDARLLSKKGGPAWPFEVAEAWAGEVYRVDGRLVRTKIDPTPAWTWRVEGGSAPAGLTVTFGREIDRDEDTTLRDVTIAFEAAPGRPLETQGTIVIESEDHPARFEVPLHVRVPPGMVVVRLHAPEKPHPLPPNEDDPWWMLVVEPRNANVPSLVNVEWEVDPAEAKDRLAVEMKQADGVVIWPLGVNGRLKPGLRYGIRPILWPRGGEAPPCTIRPILSPGDVLSPGEERGVGGITEGVGRVRARRPRIIVADAPWAYHCEDGTVVGAPPLRLELDADGGTGDWRLGLLEIPPEASLPPGAPVGWEAEPQGAGTWILRAKGPWRGTPRATFRDQAETVTVRVAWPAGAAPGDLAIPVTVPPRWGAAGWILVVLAALALALGVLGLSQVRANPVSGTLLYTVEGRAGAVGRLDLEPVGRRTRVVRADREGRLGLEGGTGAPVVTIRPTRVGGLLVAGEGDDRQEHLLVDGLTIESGRHRVRYVSGEAADDAVPPVAAPREDLLGPDFDLPTGRFDRLAAERVQRGESGVKDDPSPRQEEKPGADSSSPRS